VSKKGVGVETRSDISTETVSSLEKDASLYGYGVAYFCDGKWVRLNPKDTIVIPFEGDKPKDSVGYRPNPWCRY